MFCTKCGKAIEGTPFCKQCGEKSPAGWLDWPRVSPVAVQPKAVAAVYQQSWIKRHPLWACCLGFGILCAVIGSFTPSKSGEDKPKRAYTAAEQQREDFVLMVNLNNLRGKGRVQAVDSDNAGQAFQIMVIEGTSEAEAEYIATTNARTLCDLGFIEVDAGAGNIVWAHYECADKYKQSVTPAPATEGGTQ